MSPDGFSEEKMFYTKKVKRLTDLMVSHISCVGAYANGKDEYIFL
jgi:hypothetical protein